MRRTYTCDIDGVLADFQSYFDFFIEMLFKSKNIIVNYGDYNLARRYKISEEDLNKALNMFTDESLFRDLKKLPGAEKVSVLKPMIITARPAKAKPQTVNWLINNGIRFSNIQLTQDKGYFADPKYILGHFEDNPEFAMDFANAGVPVYLFDAPYNRHVSHPKIIRVKGWGDINIGKLADYLD